MLQDTHKATEGLSCLVTAIHHQLVPVKNSTGFQLQRREGFCYMGGSFWFHIQLTNGPLKETRLNSG